MEKLFRRGFTDAEVCEIIDITEATLNNWKKKKPAFFESLKDWKKVADSEIKRALYERARGYTHPETKVFCNGGDIVTADVERHYPPDPTSMIFWLKNRCPDEFREKVEHSVSGDLKINIVKFGDAYGNNNSE